MQQTYFVTNPPTYKSSTKGFSYLTPNIDDGSKMWFIVMYPLLQIVKTIMPQKICAASFINAFMKYIPTKIQLSTDQDIFHRNSLATHFLIHGST